MEAYWREYPWKKLNAILDNSDFWKSYLYAEAQDFELMMRPLNKVFSEYRYIYVYGAGKFANNVMNRIKGRGYSKINAIVVTDREKCCKKLYGKDVINIDDVMSNKDNTFFFIAVGKNLQGIIRKNLKNRGYKNFLVITEFMLGLLEKYD